MGPRGNALLLHHCALLGRLMGPEGRRGRDRLEAALGSDLAEILLRALVGDHRLSPRGGPLLSHS